MRTKAERAHGRPEKERLIAAVKAAREAAGVSQRGLSVAIGAHPMTIHRLERGERTLDFLEIVDIALALGMEPVDLFRAAVEK